MLSTGKIYSLEQINTPRLILRPLQLGDEFDINKCIKNTFDILKRTVFWATDDSLQASRDFVQNGVFAWQVQMVQNFPMLIINKEDGKVIGCSGFNDKTDLKKAEYEIGIWIDLDYQGRGYAKECINCLTYFALDSLSAKKVVLRIDIGNTASIAVAKSLDFTCEKKEQRDIKECVDGKKTKCYIFTCDSKKFLTEMKVDIKYKKKPNQVIKAVTWARDYLQIGLDSLFGQSKYITKNQWSSVVQLKAQDSSFFLKKVPKGLFLEVAIIKLLQEKCKLTSIPSILASDKGLSCFLMKDCHAETLREHFQGSLQLELLTYAIKVYKSLQKATTVYISDFVELGVNDWRINKIPNIYNQLLKDKIFLQEAILSPSEIARFEKYLPVLVDICNKLKSYGIDDSLNHADFHDNNILYNKVDNKITIIDLGEICISCSWFSLAGLLQDISWRYALDKNSKEYLQIQDICYAEITEDNLRVEAAKIIDILLPLYLTLTELSLINAVNKGSLSTWPQKRKDKIKQAFVCFMENIDNYNLQ